MVFVANLVASFLDPVLAVVVLVMMRVTASLHVSMRAIASVAVGTAVKMMVLMMVRATDIPDIVLPTTVVASAAWCAVYLAAAKLLRKRQA